MRSLQQITKKLAHAWKDESFLHTIHLVENLVSKVLSLAMVLVIIVGVVDLVVVLFRELQTEPYGFFNITLIELFGLFLNILIALEILENITAYLQKQVVQVELVVVTALIAVARKLIIFDFSKNSGLELVGLGVAILSLALSYWIIRRLGSHQRGN